jgi:uncharacterized membrane protein
MVKMMDFITGHRSWHRIILGGVAGGFVLFFLRHCSAEIDIIAAWDVFAFCVLVAAWLTIRMTPRPMVCDRAGKEDFTRSVIFVFVVVAACASLFAVAFLISVGSAAYLMLGLATVVLSWSLIQTVFALHYAHEFYGHRSQAGENLLFPVPVDGPKEYMPDYFDFAYFSFVIGMTFQVSDVQITSPRIRRLAFVQSVLAFAFNTIILALLINIVSDLVKASRSNGKSPPVRPAFVCLLALRCISASAGECSPLLQAFPVRRFVD